MHCLSGVVGDIRQGKAFRVRKSRNHLLPLLKKTFAAPWKCGGRVNSETTNRIMMLDGSLDSPHVRIKDRLFGPAF